MIKAYWLKSTLLLCVLGISACDSPSADRISDDVSFTLACEGKEEVSIDDEPPQTSAKVSGLFITWDASTKTLYTGQPIEDEPFCTGGGQEECSVTITPPRIAAKQFDMIAGKQPGAVSSYEEEIEVDLVSMKGQSFMRNTVGTLTDETAKVDWKIVSRRPLTCRRVQFTPLGSKELGKPMH